MARTIILHIGRLLMLSAMLLLQFDAEAQRKTFYASDFPELIAANGAKQVKDFWATTAQAEARLPNSYKWWTIIAGQTPASFLTMDIFPRVQMRPFGRATARASRRGTNAPAATASTLRGSTAPTW